MNYYGVNRYMCSALDDMRQHLKCIDHFEDFGVQTSVRILFSLVEEIQVLGNRMEASLEDLGDLERLHKDIKDKKKELKKIEDKIKKQEEKLEDKDDIYGRQYNKENVDDDS